MRVFIEIEDYLRVRLVATVHRKIGKFVKPNTVKYCQVLRNQSK